MEDEEYFDTDDIWEFYSDIYGIEFPEKIIAHHLYLYVCPVLIVIGTFGNIMAAIILFRMCEKVLSTCLYLFVICFMDLIVLYIRAGNDWIFYLTEMNIRDMAMVTSNSVCKIYPFISDFAVHFSLWLLVAMTIETALVTVRPQRLSTFFKTERARAVILLIVVLLVCINAHCFWTYALLRVDKGRPQEELLCSNAKQGNHNSEEFRRVIWPIMDIIIANCLPYLIIFPCTVLILTTRIKRKDRMRDLEAMWKSYSLDGMAAKQFQRCIVFLLFSYLILMMPKLVIDIFNFLTTPTSFNMFVFSFKTEAKTLLGQALCSVFHYIFISCKIFIYISTSKRFRTEFLKLCLSNCCRKRQKRVRELRQKPLMVRSNHNHMDHMDPMEFTDINEVSCGDIQDNISEIDPTELPSDHINSVSKRLYAITSV